MSKIWYCANCGYEVGARGRCHLCRQRLVASHLPELETGDDDEEVGYRLDDWADRERGRLIEALNREDILHRFEEDELVVAAGDEERVDDLAADLAANPEPDGSLDDGSGDVAYGWDGSTAVATLSPEDEKQVAAALQLLSDAARRLRQDPTEMQADADVAEASATVFMVDGYSGADEATWAAVGRVTRRLLSALGADEALEDEIRAQAAVLDKLVEPLLDKEPARVEADADPVAQAEAESVARAEADSVARADGEVEGEPEVELDGEETVYELPEWLPEQRVALGLLLDEAGIRYLWDEDDLVVPSDREAEVEALFGQVGTPADDGDDDDDDEDGESRYRSLEELFAAADRLAGDPGDEQRAADTVNRIHDAAGPPPLGLDEVYWFRIMTQARSLSESIEAGCEERVIAEEAASLRNLLRAVV